MFHDAWFRECKITEKSVIIYPRVRFDCFTLRIKALQSLQCPYQFTGQHYGKNREDSNLRNEQHLQDSAGRFCYTDWKKVNTVCCFQQLLPFFIHKWLLTGLFHKCGRRGRSSLKGIKCTSSIPSTQLLFHIFSASYVTQETCFDKHSHLQAFLIWQGENAQLHSMCGINEILVLH